MTFLNAAQLVALASALVGFQAPRSPQIASTSAEPLLSAWQRYFRTQADDYRLTLRAPDEDRELTPKGEPVLRWTQPVRGGDDGAVYLWLDRERPAALVSILAWPHPTGYHVVQHEWHSLAEAPLDATLDGRKLWSPTTAGVEWQPLADAPKPAASPAARSLQLRSLARRFTGHTIDDFGGDEQWDLRVLAQPLHKFDAPDAEQGSPLAGGLFALVQGTDPEVLLLLEARRGTPGGWHYALARLSDRPIHVLLDGNELRSYERSSGDRDTAAPYVVFRVEERQPPDESVAPKESK